MSPGTQAVEAIPQDNLNDSQEGESEVRACGSSKLTVQSLVRLALSTEDGLFFS